MPETPPNCLLNFGKLCHDTSEQLVCLCQLFADFLNLVRVIAATGIDPTRDLVQIVGRRPQELGTFGKLRGFQTDRVAVDSHFSDVAAHVTDSGQCHFLLDQLPFLWLQLEIDAGEFWLVSYGLLRFRRFVHNLFTPFRFE